MKARIVNLTPHAIVYVPAHGGDVARGITFPPSGMVARVPSQEPIRSEDLEVDGVLIPVYFSDIPLAPEGLPDEDGGKTLYIVSSLVGLAAAGSGRADLLVPGTGPGDGAIRDGNGHIVAVTRFKHVAC